MRRGWSLGSGGRKQLTAAGRENTRANVLGSPLDKCHSSLPLQHQLAGFTYSPRLQTCTMDSKFPSSSSPVSKLHPSPNPEFKLTLHHSQYQQQGWSKYVLMCVTRPLSNISDTWSNRILKADGEPGLFRRPGKGRRLWTLQDRILEYLHHRNYPSKI